ncbi:c-type cytochrome [Denitratisoma oestradiolicum]
MIAGLPIAARSAPASQDEGRDVYAQNCAMCHSTGVGGAPKVGSFDDWRPRLASGPSGLLVSVLRGKGGMPPKGGNASLSKTDAHAALEYMLSLAK